LWWPRWSTSWRTPGELALVVDGRVQLRNLCQRGRRSDPALPFVSGTAAIVTAVVVGVALFAIGTPVRALTGGPLLRWGLRKFGIGVAAAAVTCGLGRVFGTVLG
jgi:hypothetical protein